MKNHLLAICLSNNVLLNEVQFDNALKLCVSILGESQRADSCYIYKNETESIEYRYDSASKKTIKSRPNTKTFGFFLEIKNKIIENKPFYGHTKNLEYKLFKEYLETKKIESFLFTPISTNNKIWGFVAYENKKKIDWINEELGTLDLVAKNIGVRIYRDTLSELLKAPIENLNYYTHDTNQALWELDLHTNTTVFSCDYAEMIGYKEDTIEQTYEFWRKNIHPEDIELVEKKLQDYITNISNEYSGLKRMKHREGHYIWIKYSGLIKRNRDGNPLKIIGTHTNVTDSKEKEIQLQLSEQKYKFIAENTTDIICQHDIDGNYIYISKSFTEILGFEINEMVDKNAFNFVHPDDIVKHTTDHAKAIKTGKHDISTHRFRKKNGKYIWLETTSKNILSVNEKVIGVQTCSRDITQRIEAIKNLQNALEKEKEVNQMKSDFVSMASHQFRTPLTVIYSNAELLDLKAEKLEKKEIALIKHSTTRIKKEVERMTELMNNILIFTKYESQKLKKNIKPINLDLFIKTLVKNYFVNSSDGRKIKITRRGKIQTFYSDETLLLQIFTNLINNAFKYSIGKENPSLLINYLEDQIKIEITDYGIGVPEHEIQQLFTSFFRASNTNTIIGSGLGLSIVKQFTHFLNGTVELKTKENVGTTIKLEFPYE